jgi:hypothetical protein
MSIVRKKESRPTTQLCWRCAWSKGEKYGENKNVVVASLLRTREQGRKKETKGREKIKKDVVCSALRDDYFAAHFLGS